MAEAATVIGVVAAALQFADVTRKVIKITREVRDGAKPGSVHRKIKQLETFVAIADKIARTWTQDDPVTKSILEQCTPTVMTLLEQLERLKISDSDGLAKKAKKAILGHLENKEVEDLFGQLRWDLAALGLHRDFSSSLESNIVEAIMDGTRQLLDDRFKYSSDTSVFLRGMFVTDPRDDRAALLSRKGRRADGTCTWVSKSDVYRSWLSSTANTQGLVLEGGPGKGKSMIAIYLTEQLELLADHNHSVIYFFCDNRNPNQNNSLAVMRCLIWQLCCLKPTVVQYGTKELEERGGSIEKLLAPSSSTGFETLWRIFEAMLRDTDTGTVCCVIDGLDECDEDSLFLILDKLSGLDSLPSFRYVILSRPLGPRQRQPVRRNAVVKLRLDPDSDEQVYSDIDKFIRQRIDEIARSEKAWSQPLCQHVESVLRQKAGGTFLWVGFVTQDLQKKRQSEIKSCLKQLPLGLDGIYDRIFKSLPREHRTKIRQVLHWVCLAEHPLRLSEIAGLISNSTEQKLVSVSDSDSESGSDSFPVSDLDILNDLLAFLGHFVVVSRKTVYFVHQSAKDYLLRSKPVPDPDLEYFRVVNRHATHEEWGQRCLEILKRDLPHVKGKVSSGDYHGTSFGYAAQSWKYHIQHSGSRFQNPDMIHTVVRFLKDSDILCQKLAWFMGSKFWAGARRADDVSHLSRGIMFHLDGWFSQTIRSTSLEEYISVVTETYSVHRRPLRAAVSMDSWCCFSSVLDAFWL